MFERLLIEQAAPTLAAIKPASIFSYCPSALTEGFRQIDLWDERLSSYGLRIRPVCSCRSRNRILVFVYRERALCDALSDRQTEAFLKELGYEICCSSDKMLDQLTYRIKNSPELPHEIGLFLGYPLEDVVGFMKNKGKNHSFSGYWKSYGDPGKAMLKFRQLKRCSSVYRQLYRSGVSVTNLAITA